MPASSTVRRNMERTVKWRPVVVFAALLLMVAPRSGAAERERDTFHGDARLQTALTIRVSRTPLGELLERATTVTGAHLSAEGEDVADLKVDLFTHGKTVTAAEILTAVTDLLDAEAP